jgi:hypothetical protein
LDLPISLRWSRCNLIMPHLKHNAPHTTADTPAASVKCFGRNSPPAYRAGWRGSWDEWIHPAGMSGYTLIGNLNPLSSSINGHNSDGKSAADKKIAMRSKTHAANAAMPQAAARAPWARADTKSRRAFARPAITEKVRATIPNGQKKITAMTDWPRYVLPAAPSGEPGGSGDMYSSGTKAIRRIIAAGSIRTRDKRRKPIGCLDR